MFCLMSYTLGLLPYMIPGGTSVRPDMKKGKDPAADILHVDDVNCSPPYATPFWRYQMRHRRKCVSGNSYCVCDIFVRKNIMFMKILKRRIMKGF